MSSLPARVQRGLERLYGIDAPSVDKFIRATDEAAPEPTSREALWVRHDGEDLELAVVLPRSALRADGPRSVDDVCQVVEGVSHFLYLVERARRGLPATQLELELQAEVDKYVVLVGGIHPEGPSLEPPRGQAVRTTLFDRVRYLDPEGSERGDRYRLANRLAARWTERLEARFGRRDCFVAMRGELRRFHAAGQSEKLELARAA